LAAIPPSSSRKSDRDIREQLTEIDNGEFEVSSYEANFLESVLYKYTGPLSERQRAVALEMIERYL